MMDQNKRKQLQVLQYKILPTCGRCVHGDFKDYQWGTCRKHTYQHQKHTEATRQLSIHASGYCSPEHFQSKMENLHGFAEFETS
jgi:hypothetical protein